MIITDLWPYNLREAFVSFVIVTFGWFYWFLVDSISSFPLTTSHRRLAIVPDSRSTGYGHILQRSVLYCITCLSTTCCIIFHNSTHHCIRLQGQKKHCHKYLCTIVLSVFYRGAISWNAMKADTRNMSFNDFKLYQIKYLNLCFKIRFYLS